MLDITNNNGVFIAKLKDITRFNSVISQSVKDELSNLMYKKGNKLVFDMEGIKFVDSSAFGAMISILKVARQNNSIFKICNVSTDVKELIEVMQLDSVFEIGQDVDQCLAGM